MTNKVEKKEVPDRILREFGSDGIPAQVAEEETITPDNLDDHADSLPRPTGYRILILPFSQSSVTKGGIHLAKQTVDKERLATVVGYVVETGPDAYGDINKFPDGPWCKEGQFIIYGRYAGARFKTKFGEHRILNDDEIIATIKKPEDVLALF